MINGIINVYKEKGFTSFDVVAKMRGIFHQKKIVLIFVVAKMEKRISYDNYCEMNNKCFLIYIIFHSNIEQSLLVKLLWKIV